MKHCKEILDKEIGSLSIFCYAIQTLMGVTSLTKHRGKLLDYKGIKVIATVNPSIVIKQPHQLWEFRADINYFSRITEGWTPPDDFKWKFTHEAPRT